MFEFKISAETAAELGEKLRAVAALLTPYAVGLQPAATPPLAKESNASPSEAPAPAAQAPEEAPRRTRRKKTEEAPAAPTEDPPQDAGTSAAPGADTPAAPLSTSSGEAATVGVADSDTSSAPTASLPATGADPEEPASFEDVHRLAREVLVKHPDRTAAVQRVVALVTGTAGKIATLSPDQYAAAIVAFEAVLAELDV